MGVQDINTLLGIGGLQQGQDQKQLDIDRAIHLLNKYCLINKLVLCLISLEVFKDYNKLILQHLLLPNRTSQMLGLGIAGLWSNRSREDSGNFFSGSPVPR